MLLFLNNNNFNGLNHLRGSCNHHHLPLVCVEIYRHFSYITKVWLSNSEQIALIEYYYLKLPPVPVIVFILSSVSRIQSKITHCI